MQTKSLLDILLRKSICFRFVQTRYDINSFSRPKGTYRIFRYIAPQGISQIPSGIYIAEFIFDEFIIPYKNKKDNTGDALRDKVSSIAYYSCLFNIFL